MSKTTEDLRKEVTELGNEYDRCSRILDLIGKALDKLTSKDKAERKALLFAEDMFFKRAEKLQIKSKQLKQKIKRLES